MMENHQWPWIKKVGLSVAFTTLLVSFFLRFYAIHQPHFFLFDEGYYLNFNYKFVQAVATHPPQNFQEFGDIFYTLMRVSLRTGKALWFMLVDARVFWGAGEAWYFPRIVSAMAGALTLFLTYFFAKKFYQSKGTAILSAALLSILPSHIFYSRLAIQEALSGLFFLLGFYFYLFPRQFSHRTFISAVFFSCAYFTNYRLIFIPFLIVLTEILWYFISPEKNNFAKSLRRYVWHTLTFFFMVFFIGGLDQGENIKLNFAWMFYQQNLAKKHVELINFFSYPYYLFRLESVVLGLLFFANIYFIVRKQWRMSFPFLLVLVLMAVFSMTSDKGARYMCVGLPFVAMAVSSLLTFILKKEKVQKRQWITLAMGVFLFISLLPKATTFAFARSDYKNSVEFLRTHDPTAKILSTQPWVQKLFVDNKDDVSAAPYGFKRLLFWYAQGYHYLIIDPQAYISYTESENKFDFQLKEVLGFLDSRVKPIKIFPHFNSLILERIVFEHNENLRRSISFLRYNKKKNLGTLRIYDIKNFILTLNPNFALETRYRQYSRHKMLPCKRWVYPDKRGQILERFDQSALRADFAIAKSGFNQLSASQNENERGEYLPPDNVESINSRDLYDKIFRSRGK